MVSGFTLLPMGPQGRTRLTVEIEDLDGRLTGWLQDPTGEKQHFDGWLEFANVINSVAQLVPGEHKPEGDST